MKEGQTVKAKYDTYTFTGVIVQVGKENCVVVSNEDNCKYTCKTETIKLIKNGKRV